jgi:arginyl-tRNA synthetase
MPRTVHAILPLESSPFYTEPGPLRQQLQILVAKAVGSLIETGELEIESLPEVQMDVPRNSEHGDFSTNIAMVLAKPSRMLPRQLAERIVGAMDDPAFVKNIRIEGPGFINFTLDVHAFTGIIAEILEQGSAYGRSDIGAGRRVQVEFVSANPTGPLHIGHGRGAAYGAAIADLLDAVGYRVSREYYVNDAGRR